MRGYIVGAPESTAAHALQGSQCQARLSRSLPLLQCQSRPPHPGAGATQLPTPAQTILTVARTMKKRCNSAGSPLPEVS